MRGVLRGTHTWNGEELFLDTAEGTRVRLHVGTGVELPPYGTQVEATGQLTCDATGKPTRMHGAAIALLVDQSDSR